MKTKAVIQRVAGAYGVAFVRGEWLVVGDCGKTAAEATAWVQFEKFASKEEATEQCRKWAMAEATSQASIKVEGGVNDATRAGQDGVQLR